MASVAADDKKHRLTVLEFIDTETAYTKYLRVFASSSFVSSFNTHAGVTFKTKAKLSPALVSLFSEMMDWWKALLRLHEDLDAELNAKCFRGSGNRELLPNSGVLLLEALIKRAPFLKAYAEYCRLHPVVLEVIKKERQSSPLFESLITNFQTSAEAQGLSIQSFLIKPIQRVCKYPLLLRELKKNSQKNARIDIRKLEKAIDIVNLAVDAVNASSHAREATDELITIQECLRPAKFINLFFNVIRTNRRLSRRFDANVVRMIQPRGSGQTSVVENNKKKDSSNGLVPVSGDAGEKIHVILLTDLLIFTRRVVKHKTMFRRQEKTRFHIAEMVSLRDARVSGIAHPSIKTKGLSPDSTLIFQNLAGDSWCLDVGSSTVKKELVGIIQENIQSYTKSIVARQESSRKRNSRTERLSNTLVQPKNLHSANRKSKSSVDEPGLSPGQAFIMQCPQCKSRMKIVQGKTLIKCHRNECNAFFTVTYDSIAKSYIGEAIEHHGLLEWNGKNVYVLLTSFQGKALLRWFDNQMELVNQGVSSAIGEYKLSASTFLRHDELEANSQRVRKGFILKDKNTHLMETFLALFPSDREKWVEKLMQTIKSLAENHVVKDFLCEPLNRADARAEALASSVQNGSIDVLLKDLYTTKR